MHTITLIGAGKIGEAICALLSSSGRYELRVGDSNGDRLHKISTLFPHCKTEKLSISDNRHLTHAIQGSAAVISALPFSCNVPVAQIAAQLGVHYFDLTEDLTTTQTITDLARSAHSLFMPQCGLAPGFISIAGYHLAKMFDELQVLKLRVGALPIYPTNRLKYNLTWSTEGLVNEYGNPCEVIHNGIKTSALPLEGLEQFSLDGAEYEAFNTSGGLGSLCETLAGKVRTLNYKTIRYPGHRELIAMLMHDLRFNEDRATLVKVFERSLGITPQDKCIILVEATGKINGELVQKTYASTVYNAQIHYRHYSAIQITTAAGVCGAMDLVLNGACKNRKGVARVEELSLTDFLSNEFGKYYRDEKALSGISS